MARLLRRPSTSVALIFASAAYFSFVSVGSALAADPSPDDQWYLGLQGGVVFPDRAREEQDAAAAGLSFGKVLGPSWNLEFNALESQHSGDYGMPALSLRQYSVDTLRVFDRSHRVAPFVKVGVGLLQDELKGQNSQTNVMGEAGVGVIVHAWTSGDGRYSFDVRPEADLRWDGCHDCGQTMTDGLIRIGFVLSFGGEVAAPRPAPAPAPPAHADAPAPPAPPAPSALLTAAPSPPPPPVPQTAPPSPTPIVLTGVHFATNSAVLRPESHDFLDRVAAGLKANPDIHIALEGYTDSTGSVAYNLGLSQRRADAVRGYLMDQGVSGSQLSAKGIGLADPIATNGTSVGRQANRRTVMRVTSNPNDVPVQKVLCGSSC